MQYQQLLQCLFENGTSKKSQFDSKIIKSQVPIIGCTVPFVRSLAKKCTDSLEDVLSLPVHAYYEVDLYKGMVVSLAKLPFEKKIGYLDIFANTIENWAVCDCCVVKVPAAERSLYFDYFCQISQSDKPFVCRYGLVNLLSYLDEQYIEKVFAILEKITCWGHYYVDMAVAWLVATAMAVCRNQTVTFLQGNARQILNIFSYNMALQKIRDSYRISDADKQWTKTLKR